MDMVAQRIIDAIQRGEKNEGGDFVEKDIDDLVKEADKYLLESGEKPGFFDIFIDKTLTDLKTTINGCVKSRNKKNKKDDIKKYKEGYFNEIIQNANDVVWKTDIKKPVVQISVYREDSKYSVSCRYPDIGFSLENIYGFCTRGNSNKDPRNGQEGMYGIGIKSLFCFVDKFEIKSNIHILIDTGKKLLDTVSIERNELPTDGYTVLSFEFTYDLTQPDLSKYAGFNVKKLAEFIDWTLQQNKSEEDISKLDKWFLAGKDEEIIFDTKSFFFTELRGERNGENSIKTLSFYQNDFEENNTLFKITTDEIPIHLERSPQIDINPERLVIKQSEVGVSYKNKNILYKYLVIHFKDDEEPLTYAFQYEKGKNIGNDKIYATYFVGSYLSPKTLLGRETGCLINTTAINSSRSGLERENEKEPPVLGKIMDKGKDTISILCALSVSNHVAREILSRLMWCFKDECDTSGDVCSPKYIFEDAIPVLEKAMQEWHFENGKSLILKEEDDVDNEKGEISKNRPGNPDDDVKGLFGFYKEYIFKNDVILKNDNEYKCLGSGVRDLAECIFDDTNEEKWVSQIRSIPFLKNVKTLIINRIGGSDFESIIKFLGSIKEDNYVFLNRLVARYEVNDCFDLMGNYSDNNIRNWLFDTANSENITDEAYKNVVTEYEEIYGELKGYIKNHIGRMKYYYSLNWNASSDWWYERVFESKGFEQNADEKTDSVILKLLKLINCNNLLLGIEKYDNIYNRFVHNYKERITIRNRQRNTCSWDGTFSYFPLNIFDYEFHSFHAFVSARKLIDEYNDKLIDEYNDKDRVYNYVIPNWYSRKCKVKASVADLTEIFKWSATYDFKRFNDNSVDVFNISLIIDKDKFPENKSDLIEFVKIFIGKDVYVRVEKIEIENNRGRHFSGCITNINGRGEYFIKQSSEDAYSGKGKVESDGGKFLIIAYSQNEDEHNVFSNVLSWLEKGDELCYYIKNFINTGNIRTLSSEIFDRLLKKKKNEYVYPFEEEGYEIDELSDDLNIDDLYDILSSELSYDDHCPICNQIPTLNVLDGTVENIRRWEKRNCQIAMFTANYQEKTIFTKILCCKSCLEECKKSLSKAKILDEDDCHPYNKVLRLCSRIITSNRADDLVNEIPISPDNWNIIKKFNKIDNIKGE
ncbi:MAG: hypothetical protein K5655_02250 [Lachnospiraceae bacterium]|nr:hypothetical protein [Lachnospiraceae bacterium]